jgi:thymidylate synthase ThyX
MKRDVNSPSNGDEMKSFVPEVHHTPAGTPYLREPGIALVAMPQFLPTEATNFVNSYGDQFDAADYENDWFEDKLNVADVGGMALDDGAALCKFAGQTCYLSFGETRTRNADAKKYFDNIKSSGHGSVIEHAYYSFVVWGVDRAWSHEAVRHRAGWAYCLAGDTEVWSGSQCNGRFDGVKRRWTLEELWEASQNPRRRGPLKQARIRCFDGSQFVPAPIKAVMKSGRKPIVRVTLSDGKQIRCSADHRFLTPDGWSAIRELAAGVPLATNGLPAVGLTERVLREKYIVEGKLLSDVASEVGCSPNTVRKWLRVFGLQKAQGQGMFGRIPWNAGKTYTTGYRHTTETKRLLSEAKQGEKNPMWKGDGISPQAGRLRALRLFPTEPCEACGVAEGHRHHKDRDTFNNVRSNIEFLCASCHTSRHLDEDGHPNILTVKWVAIESIVPDGCEMTYDLEVDHPAHNFVANGFVTHNSQLSQRYVSGKQLRFVERPEYQNDKRLHFEFEQWIDKAKAQYDLRAELLMAKAETWKVEKVLTKTELRKSVNSAARNCLPNETETAMVLTGNVRAWRHVLEMRGSEHADIPIHQTTVRIAEILQEVSPILFDDYEKKTVKGRTILDTRFKKV